MVNNRVASSPGNLESTWILLEGPCCSGKSTWNGFFTWKHLEENFWAVNIFYPWPILREISSKTPSKKKFPPAAGFLIVLLDIVLWLLNVKTNRGWWRLSSWDRVITLRLALGSSSIALLLPGFWPLLLKSLLLCNFLSYYPIWYQ